MATARAIASGNWSATGTWNGGVIPGNGDTVYANGFTVTIDQNVNIGGANNPIVNAGSFVSGQWYEVTTVGTTSFTGIGAAANTVGTIFQASGVGSGTGQARARATLTTATNTPAGATAGGGGFAMSTSYNMTCDLRAGTSACLTVTGSAGFTLESAQVHAGNVTNTPAITCSGSGSITINNSFFRSATSGATQNVVLNTGTATFTINTGDSLINNGGNCFSNTSSGNFVFNSSTFTGGFNGAVCVIHQSTATGNSTFNLCTISGVNSGSSPIRNLGSGNFVFNNSTINGIGAVCVSSEAAGVVSGNGSVFTAISNVALANTSASGSIILTSCTVTASSGFNAITSSSANNRFSGNLISAANGMQPISAARWWLGTAPTVSYIQHALDGANSNSFVRFFTGDNSTALNQAAPTDVRSGVAYGIASSQTGRLTVPARGSVALSVNYGPSMPFSATVIGTTATATLAYSYPLVVGDTITVTGSNNPEWNSTYTIASVVSGTSVTFVVPATHSSTTAGTGALMQTTGTAVLDPAAVASAVWGAASRTITGGLVDTATTLTNAPTVPSVVQIRQEMDANSTKLANLDTTVSSRLSPSGTLATVTTLTNAPTVPSAAAIATQVWAVADKTGYSLTSAERSAIAAAVEASILNEGDGQAILNAIVTAIGNTNISQVALVAAIRADMERNGGTLASLPESVRSNLATELGRIDAAISTRAIPADIPTANITAIKAKTDALPASPAATGDIPTESEIAAEVWAKPTTELTITGSIGERAKNQSTVSTTGAQLAAALS